MRVACGDLTAEFFTMMAADHLVEGLLQIARSTAKAPRREAEVTPQAEMLSQQGAPDAPRPPQQGTQYFSIAEVETDHMMQAVVTNHTEYDKAVADQQFVTHECETLEALRQRRKGHRPLGLPG